MSDPQHAPSVPPKPESEPVASSGKLASFMVTNIVLLVIVCGASILVLLFGNFDGKVIRTITTLVLFALFTVFAAMDSRRDKPQRYITISQVGHIYMLGMGLVLIWGSLAARRSFFFDEFSILTKTLLIVLLVKAGVVAVQRVSDLVHSPQQQLSLSSRLCAYSLALTAFLYTLPIGTDYFITFNEAYWKFAVAVLLFAGLAVSVTALLAYYLGTGQGGRSSKKITDHDEPIRVISRVEPQAAQKQQVGAHAAPFHLDEEIPSGTQKEPPYAAGAHSQQVPATPVTYARPAAGVQPWPVFPDGRPLPATQNGRPDFAVLQYVASVHAEAERQWFSGNSPQ